MVWAISAAMLLFVMPSLVTPINGLYQPRSGSVYLLSWPEVLVSTHFKLRISFWITCLFITSDSVIKTPVSNLFHIPFGFLLGSKGFLVALRVLYVS